MKSVSTSRESDEECGQHKWINYEIFMGKNKSVSRILFEENDERQWGGNSCCEPPTRDGNVWQRSESTAMSGLV